MNKSEKARDFIISVCLFIIPMLFLGYQGVFSCGFHLTDDHEIVSLTSAIHKYGYFNTLLTTIRGDLSIRFRPVYWIVRVTRALLFGNNVRLWHICTSVEISLLIVLGYIFARQMGSKRFLAIIFSVVYLIGGGQSEVIWRLGPQEGLGCVLLLSSLVIFGCYYKKRTLIIQIIMTFLIIFMMGTKESFFLMGIGVLLFIIYKEFSSFEENIISILKRYMIVFLSVLIATIVGFVIIFKVVGLNQIGYAGIDKTYRMYDYILGIRQIIFNNLSPYFSFLLVVLSLMICSTVMGARGNLKKRYILQFLTEMSFIGYGVLSQCILYTKSGMENRYILPTALIILIFCMLMSQYSVNESVISKSAKDCLLVVLAIGIICRTTVISEVNKYVNEGNNTTKMLSRVAEISEPGTEIVVNLSWDEWNGAVVHFMKELYNIDSVTSPDVYKIDIDGIDRADVYIMESGNLTENNMIKDNLEVFGDFAIQY